MAKLIYNLLFCLIMAISCKIYYETILAKERVRWGRRWTEPAQLLLFTLGFYMIAVTKIPPYIFQPVRFIAVLMIVVQIFYRARVIQNLILSVLFSGIFWIAGSIISITVYSYQCRAMMGREEDMSFLVQLCLVLLFRRLYQKRKYMLDDKNWIRFGYFPIFSMAVIVALNMVTWNLDGNTGILMVVFCGFGVINLSAFFFIGNILEREKQIQDMRLAQERAQNQMNWYRSMKADYERQRKQLHDYGSHIGCIQGLLMDKQNEEALRYISRLSGRLKKNAYCINTNHAVVNVILNQKYQNLQENNITMAVMVNDLSGLLIEEEDIVTLLANLFDNAAEACQKLDHDKMIRFKMVIEDGQLILSISNPVKEPVNLKGKTAVSTKRDKTGHGIGLNNVDEVIQKYGGTSRLQCADGWFSFSAMLPAEGIK